MTDEAAEIILDAARHTNDADTCAWLLGYVEEIRIYREAREHWSQTKSESTSAAAAITELISMLSSHEPSVRREAARALATLRAVEALTALIKLLADPVEDVRKAAQESLDRLNGRSKQN